MRMRDVVNLGTPHQRLGRYVVANVISGILVFGLALRFGTWAALGGGLIWLFASFAGRYGQSLSDDGRPSKRS